MPKEIPKRPKPLDELKFDSIGEEYIYLYEFLSTNDGLGLIQESADKPTIEGLRAAYQQQITKDKDKLEKKYEKTSIYWSEEQEEAIVAFLKATTESERNRIFSRYLYKPLKKLVENIIFTYKLFRNDVDINELQSDCVSFLMTKIEKYDHRTGAKAFAYLGTIAKHYLMGEKRASYKTTKANIDIDEHMDEASERPENVYNIDEFVEKKKGGMAIFEEIITQIDLEIQSPRMLPNDKKVGEAIVWIFRNHEMLNVYNKNLVYHLLKERTGLQTKEITYSLSRFKGFYKLFKEEFLKRLG
jgi:hypothetical protein